MKNKFKYTLIVINCLLTFLNQLIYHYEPASDSLTYLKLAKQYTQFIFFDPETNCYGHTFYALFLATIGSIISYHHFVVGLIQSLIFCFSSLLLIGELEKKLKQNLSGLMIILFLVPEIHFHNGYILTESLAFTLIIFSFYLALKIYNNKATILNILFLSFTISIAILNRFECAVIIFPILFLIYPKIKGKLISQVFILTSIPLLIIQINGFRNYKIFNNYKLTAFNGGEVIYGGNSENLDGSHHVFWKHKEIFIPKNKIDDFDKIISQPECLSCPKKDSFLLKLAIESWQKNPIQQVKVIPQKLAKNWLLPGMFDIYTADTTKTRGLQLNNILSKKYFHNLWYAPYKHLFYMIIHWAILIMLLIGLFKLDKHNRFQLSVLILLAFYVLFAVPFSGLPRWHVGIFPLLIITFTPRSLIETINKNMRRFIS